ncbi:MAG: hypothetical protein U5R06_05310 [candidate division KSB1 bacterium]|nr:hypothetical protein [candidate division KSB1 bacterium]
MRYNFIQITRFIFLWMLCFNLASALFVSPVHAQDSQTELMKTGRIWAVVNVPGNTMGAVSSGWFPAEFNVYAFGQHRHLLSGGAKDVSIHMYDYIPPDGEVYPQSVWAPVIAEIDTRPNMVEPLKSYVRYGYPENLVNDEHVGSSVLGEVNPDEMIGNSDQIVTSTFDYPNGVRAERKVFAFHNQNHDDYIVADWTFTNVTHQVSYAEEQTFKNVVLSQAWDEASRAWGTVPEPEGLSPEHYLWWHYYGAMLADSQRVYYYYHADDPKQSGDTMGNPCFGQENRLIQPGAPFWGFLHVSKEPYSNPAQDVDDPVQPITTFVAKTIGGGSGDYSHPDERTFETFYGAESDRHPKPDSPAGTHHHINNDEFGNPDFQAFSQMVSFHSGNHVYAAIGPYDEWAPGEQIRYVYVVGESGLSVQKATEIGRKMLDQTLEPPQGLPDPETGFFPDNFAFPEGATPMDLNKDLWLSTSIDSVHNAMYRARWNFEHDWKVPSAPPAPNMQVKPFGGYTKLTWSCPEAEALSNFSGYRILRRKSNMDTASFDVIASLTPDELQRLEHTYEDDDVQFGASYYYYIQSGIRISENNMNALPEQRGKMLWSGRSLLPTPVSVKPMRGGTETLKDIVIAPNPYNINDPRVIAQGWTDYRGIVFFNLPAFCEITIYTEDGDKVYSFVHDSPLEIGSAYWDMLTDYQQVISSGVYIATFEKKDGEVAFRKFVVAR